MFYYFSEDKSKDICRNYKNNGQQRVIFYYNLSCTKIIRDKVFKNGPSKIFERQPVKYLKAFGLLEVDHTPSNLLKAVFHKFYLVHF